MKAKRTTEQFLVDIVEWADRIARYVNGVTHERFITETLLQDAVAKCIENIGEAAIRATRLAPKLAEDNPDFEADFAYGARNAVAHGYFDIDYDTLWHTAQVSVPKIALVARRILHDRAKGSKA